MVLAVAASLMFLLSFVVRKNDRPCVEKSSWSERIDL